MCGLGGSSKPKAVAPPAVQPPPPPAKPMAQSDAAIKRDAQGVNRGRNSLRIDRTTNTADMSGSGLNIPT